MRQDGLPAKLAQGFVAAAHALRFSTGEQHADDSGRRAGKLLAHVNDDAILAHLALGNRIAVPLIERDVLRHLLVGIKPDLRHSRAQRLPLRQRQQPPADAAALQRRGHGHAPDQQMIAGWLHDENAKDLAGLAFGNPTLAAPQHIGIVDGQRLRPPANALDERLIGGMRQSFDPRSIGGVGTAESEGNRDSFAQLKAFDPIGHPALTSRRRRCCVAATAPAQAGAKTIIPGGTYVFEKSCFNRHRAGGAGRPAAAGAGLGRRHHGGRHRHRRASSAGCLPRRHQGRAEGPGLRGRQEHQLCL